LLNLKSKKKGKKSASPVAASSPPQIFTFFLKKLQRKSNHVALRGPHTGMTGFDIGGAKNFCCPTTRQI
jgi:hypothetical protein